MIIQVLLLIFFVILIFILIKIIKRNKNSNFNNTSLSLNNSNSILPKSEATFANLEYEINLTSVISRISSIPSSSQENMVASKTYDNDFTSGWLPTKTSDGKYSLEFIFNTPVILKKIRIYSGYSKSNNWEQLVVRNIDNNRNQIVLGTFTNTNPTSKFDFYNYDEFKLNYKSENGAITPPLTKCRLDFTAINEPCFIREVVFFGVVTLQRPNRDLELNGYKINPNINAMTNPTQISLFNNNYRDYIPYTTLNTIFKVFDEKLNEDILKIVIPFDKVYSFYKVILYIRIKNDISNNLLIRVGGVNIDSRVNDLIQVVGIDENTTAKQEILFLPIIDNKLVIDFINTNNTFSISNIDFYGFDVIFPYYDQINIINTKQEKIAISELEVYNEKFENILPDYVKKGKISIFERPSEIDYISKIEIERDPGDLIVLDDANIRENPTIYKRYIKGDISTYTFNINAPIDFGKIKKFTIRAYDLKREDFIQTNLGYEILTLEDVNKNRLYSIYIYRNELNYQDYQVDKIYDITRDLTNAVTYLDNESSFIIKDLTLSQFPLKVIVNTNPQGLNDMVQGEFYMEINIEYYKNIAYAVKIPELRVFELDSKGEGKLLPKYNSITNSLNYDIISNSTKANIPYNMIYYQEQNDIDTYYKTDVIQTQDVTINLVFAPQKISKVYIKLNKMTNVSIKIEYIAITFEEIKYKETQYVNFTDDITINTSFLQDKKYNKIIFTLLQVNPSNQIEIKTIKIYNEYNIQTNDMAISASNYYKEGTTNLSDGSYNTYYKNRGNIPLKLSIIFSKPINISSIVLDGFEDMYNTSFYYSLLNTNVKFFNVYNQLKYSYYIDTPNTSYVIKYPLVNGFKNNIRNIYDNDSNTYGSTLEKSTFNYNNPNNKIDNPVIVILFSEPTALTGIKVHNLKSIFLDSKNNIQGDNNIFGTYIHTTLNTRWSNPNSPTPFICKSVPSSPEGGNRFVAFRINNEGKSECMSKDRNICLKFDDIKSCEEETLITSDKFNKSCGTGYDFQDDCSYYQKYVKNNILCMTNNNGKKIKVIKNRDTQNLECVSESVSLPPPLPTTMGFKTLTLTSNDPNVKITKCKEYNTYNDCMNDTTYNPTDTLTCYDYNINNPNHWCNEANYNFNQNIYNTVYKVYDISGNINPRYCRIELEEPGTCTDKIVSWNPDKSDFDIIYENAQERFIPIWGNVTNIPSSLDSFNCNYVADYIADKKGYTVRNTDCKNRRILFTKPC